MPKKLLRRFHWQNLNECKKCGEPHGFPYEGRCWWTIWEPDASGEPSRDVFGTNFEWHLWGKRKSLALGFETGDGDGGNGLQWRVAVPFLFTLYFSIEKVSWKWAAKEREWSLRYDWEFGDLGSLWWDFGTDPWGDSGRSWRHGSFDPADFLFGREVYSSVKEWTQIYQLSLPEGWYEVAVTQEKATWKRPRWPWAKNRVGYDCVPEKPLPIPGKGENSWDCDDDAIFSHHCGAKTPEEALLSLRDSVLRSRKRYGGAGWLPPSPKSEEIAV